MGKRGYTRWNGGYLTRKDLLHNHNYYNRECKICRQYVNDLFYKYFDDIYRLKSMHEKRRRANCGHSCLKYTIIFYCVITIIVSICVICYSSKMFGLMSDLMEESLPKLNNPRLEIYSIIISSIVMLIFFIGLIGSLLESLLCLRVFGGIVAYLFLLTFGAFLYMVILMIITNSPIKLITSVGSSAAAAIVIHASMAIAPFALADLIQQEREDARSETYVKYPSVRYLPHNTFNGSASYPLGVGPYSPYGYSSQTPVLHDMSDASAVRMPSAAKTSSQVRFQDDWL